MSARDLLHRFRAPGAEHGPLPLWWWSGAPLTLSRLCWQMDRLAGQGVRQAVVMCLAPAGPTYGSLADDPPFLSPAWLDLLDGVCAHADRIGFRLWMYDQIGFSGANFQGRLTAARPEFAGRALYRDTDGSIAERVSGFDYFGAEACAALLASVHGTLDAAVGHWFGTVIPGFFTDELPAMPTWGTDFAATFADRYGYDLVPRRAALFGGADDGSARVRRDYHAHRATLARRAFFDPQRAWFDRRGLICGFDQQSPAREGDPVGGTRLYGDYLGTHAGYGAPGCDHWGDVKVHSSLAHAHGRPRTWIEAFHSSGWGGTLEETYDWLAPFLRRGATLYDPHAVYYSTAGGWWEWAPPSTCWRQPYWPSYHRFAGAVARLCAVLTAGRHVCDVALLAPTGTAQAYLTLDGPLEPATTAAATYHALNGTGRWYAERPGVLERAGVDHDVLDEATVAGAAVTPDGLAVGDEHYRTVVLPDVTVLDPAAARTLVRLAGSGGRVLAVGAVPAALRGHAVELSTAAEVPAALADAPVRVHADVPALLRRHGDTHVLLLTAHDERSGTRSPIVDLSTEDWTGSGFPWDAYWRRMHETGYRFVPPGDRVATVAVDGLTPRRAQRWDPGTGALTELPVRITDGGCAFEVSFPDGPIALVVLGDELPAPTRTDPGPVTATTPVDGPWRAAAESTLDNRHADLAAADRTGVLPVEVWRLEHERDGGWHPVTAGFGPFADVRDPDGTWRPAEWSLSRGIRDDPAHADTLGPKGHVPEEFLDWRSVPEGGTVAVRTHLPLPDRAGLWLAVGAGAARTVTVDGGRLPVDGDGYLTFSPLPDDLAGRTVPVTIELTADRDGPLRASFAVVTDPGAYRRPEWLAGTPTRTVHLDTVPAGATLQVAGEGACTVRLNGTELGRQGDFHPYPGVRDVQVHRYPLAGALRPGDNTLTLTPADGGLVACDATGVAFTTGPGWTGATAHRGHRRDPRFICLRPRPHPLPGAHWLEPAAAGGDTVPAVVPDRDPAGPRTERLRFAAPLGTTGLRLHTGLPVRVHVGGTAHSPMDGRVTLPGPLPAGTGIVLECAAADGRRGGALLDAAVEVDTAEADLPALRSWEELGLRALGGAVRYRTTVVRPDTTARVTLDLGTVRGTAEVLLNGTLVDRLVWGPWRVEVTDALRPGGNTLEVVVRGTLAGYLDDASPTGAVAAGQVRTGLFGPVTLATHEPQEPR